MFKFLRTWFPYFNNLSINAVLIALFWQALFSDLLKVSLMWQERVILGLSVWLVYLGDHLLDVRDLGEEELPLERHEWVKKNERWLWWVFRLGLILDVFLALGSLSLSKLVAGLVLLAGCIVYVKKIARSEHILLKGVIVALFFAAGVFLFLLSAFSDVEFWLYGMLMFFLCLGNILSTASAEAKLEKKTPLDLAYIVMIFSATFLYACFLAFTIRPLGPLLALLSVSGSFLCYILLIRGVVIDEYNFGFFVDICLWTALIGLVF